MTTPSRQASNRARRALATTWLLMLLTACGGGGGGGGGGGDDDGGGGGGGPSPTPTTDLEARLASCPVTDARLNEAVPCLVGLWEGRTADGTQDCAMQYRADGTAYFQVGDQAQRIALATGSSGSVFAKRASSSSASGYSIVAALGIASGHELDLYFQDADHPESASVLLAQPDDDTVPACRFSHAPTAAATGAAATRNDTGRAWTAASEPDAARHVEALTDHPGFEAGLADGGRAYIAYRHRLEGRPAVLVTEGLANGSGTAPSWSAPVILDGNPLTVGGTAPQLDAEARPHLAVSPAGHAVVAWIAQLPCDAQGYEAEPAGKGCRTLVASRRLAGDATWEPAQVVRAASPNGDLDLVPRINDRGDVLILFTTFEQVGYSSTDSALAWRGAADAGYGLSRLTWWWSNPFDDAPISQRLKVDLDDAGIVTVAGLSSGISGGLAYARSPLASLPATWTSPEQASGLNAVQSLGRSAHGTGLLGTTLSGEATYPAMPDAFIAWSSSAGQWLEPQDVARQVMWGASRLVGVDGATEADGALLLHAGCRVSAWQHDAWGPTTALPAWCGLDAEAGVFAFNRLGDYVGLNWGGQPGQWGAYRRRDNTLLKGAPGSGSSQAGDYVTGIASDAFADAHTQLRLAGDGQALAVTANDYSQLPSADDAAGQRDGATGHLWATWLK